MRKGNLKRGKRKTNQVRINASGHDDLFYQGSVLKNLVPIEEVIKAGSIATLSLSQTVTQTDRGFSLITWVTKTPQGPPHTWCLLLALQSTYENKNREGESNPSNKSNKITQVILSQVSKH
jgi:hypothetical protein